MTTDSDGVGGGARSDAAERYDWVLRGGYVVDGTGAAARRADVAVRGERIAAVGDVAGSAGSEIAAAGQVVAPGFIDVHTHDDFAVVVNPQMDFKVMQGVTTEVVGNCGMGAAPFPQASVFAAAVHPGKQLAAWQGYRGYLERLDDDPSSVNVAALVGHGTLRAAAMGGDARAPEAAELNAMKRNLVEGLDAGAVGFSTGLIYEPGRNADTSELVELAREMAGSGGLYATHMRDEAAGLLDSIRETLTIGASGGVPVQVSHHKSTGRQNWGLVKQSLALIDEARGTGLDVTADQYPYTAGSTVLAAVVQVGGQGDAARGRFWEEGARDVVIASTPGHPEYEGRAIADLAAEWGLGAEATARRVLDEEPAAWVVMHSMCEEDVRTVLAHPSTMIGSDGVPTDTGKPHPRLYGTFARVLGTYVRDQRVLGLEEAVHRMTGLPAEKFRLSGRGRVEVGAFADLVVFDAARIEDVSSYEDPRRHPAGIHQVLVNGTAVVRDGVHTGARPGRALRRA